MILDRMSKVKAKMQPWSGQLLGPWRDDDNFFHTKTAFTATL